MSSSTETAQLSRRRRRWLAIVLLIGLGAVALILRAMRLEERTRAWLAEANRRSIVTDYETVCIIPGFRDNQLGKLLLGRRQIFAVATQPSHVDSLLSMPACPVKLLVGTGVDLPDPDVARLQQHLAKGRN